MSTNRPQGGLDKVPEVAQRRARHVPLQITIVGVVSGSSPGTESAGILDIKRMSVMLYR